ncbi:MAG TPA: crotonase/enoyl-CoA hydratase family protein [Burkholderiales bacterium]|nr:crotonase/enoyl-CoA hydratase family protein [Burkholderiales bacterium]
MSNMRDAVGLYLPYGKGNSQYQTQFEPATGTIWGYFNPRGTACFSLGLLKDIRVHDEALTANNGQVEVGGQMMRASQYVLASRTPHVFNLGGDLALFVLLIKARDREALAHYARLCIDDLYPRIQNFSCPTLTTISLVQGDALGGGFEAALTSDVIVAEERAQMGLPEILFNLFPGMGAYSLLSRRIGMREAEQLILSGRILSAAKLHEMGVVDVLAPDGQGEAAVREWIAKNAKRRNGMQAVHRARALVQPVTREELDAIANVWVDAAMRLEDRDLKMMSRIVRAQMRRMESGDVSDITAMALAEERVGAAG